MAMKTAPYTNAMRLGQGFNSFTHEICVNNAVVKENKQLASESDLKNAKEPIPSLTPEAEISQEVTYSARFVDTASEVLSDMNISGQLELKIQGLGGGGGRGKYIKTDSMNKSQINFLVSVKVINQKLVADDVTRFNAIPNVPSASFTDVYGDSFISGFVEGGEFYALLSIAVENAKDKLEIEGEIHASMNKGVVERSIKAEGEYSKLNDTKSSKVTISVAWSGGGQIRPPEDVGKEWTIESMKRAANGFAEKVAKFPQRTHAILTKYTSLRSYQELKNKGTPLDYENAGIYTGALLDAYMEYKEIWRIIDVRTKLLQGAHTLKTADEFDPEFDEYARQAQHDYMRKIKAYYYKDGQMPEELAAALQPSSRKLIASASFKDSPQTAPDSDADLSNREQRLALIDHDITAAQKKLAVVSKGDGFEPPLRPNTIQPYPATTIGLARARTDCRFEMIKIVREVDAVTNDPQVASDPDRIWQYLSPSVFRQLLPTDGEGPFTKAQRDAAVKEVENAKEKAVEKANIEKKEAVEKAITEKDEAVKKANTEKEEAVAAEKTKSDSLTKEKLALEDEVKMLKSDTRLSETETKLKTLQSTHDKCKSADELYSKLGDLEDQMRKIPDVKAKLPAGPFAGRLVDRGLPAFTADDANASRATKITYPTSLVDAPSVIMGLSMFDYNTLDDDYMNVNTAYSTGDRSSVTLSRNVAKGLRQQGISWATLPTKMRVPIESTTFSCENFSKANPGIQKVDFINKGNFNGPPIVVAWIQQIKFKWRNSRDDFARVTVDVSAITQKDCTITVSVWEDDAGTIPHCVVRWLAYDASANGVSIFNGSVGGRGFAVTGTTTVDFTTSDFFERTGNPPAVFCAFRHLDFKAENGKRAGFSIDATEVSRSGMKVAVNNIGKGHCTEMGGVYLAFAVEGPPAAGRTIMTEPSDIPGVVLDIIH